MAVRMVIRCSKSHTMSIPKGAAGVMASFLEEAGLSGEIAATVITQIKGVPQPGMTIGQVQGRSAVQVKVQASTSQGDRRIFNLIVPDGHVADEFHRKLKEVETRRKQKVAEVAMTTESADTDEDEVACDPVAESMPEEVSTVVVEADEETILIAEAYELDDEHNRLEKQIEQLNGAQVSLQQAIERNRVERTSLERRLAVISQEIMEAEAVISRDVGVLVALRERHRQVAVRREEVEARVDSLSAQRSIDEAVSRAKPTVEGLMSELKGLSGEARREALQKIVAMLES